MRIIFRLIAAALATGAMIACQSSSVKNDGKEDAVAAEQETVAVDEQKTVPATAPEAGVVNVLPDGATIAPADKPILIDFSAVWCGPCKRFAPTFEDAAKNNADKFYFYTVDIDKCPQMKEAYGVQSIPQVSVLYPDGRIVNHEPGYMEAEEFAAFLGTL